MPEEKKSRYTEAQNRATQKYIRENLEEIKFRVKKGDKDKYKSAAENAGLSMAKFFLSAADESDLPLQVDHIYQLFAALIYWMVIVFDKEITDNM